MCQLSVLIPFSVWNDAIQTQLDSIQNQLHRLDVPSELIMLSLGTEPVCSNPHTAGSTQLRWMNIRNPKSYSSAILAGFQSGTGSQFLHLPPGMTLESSQLADWIAKLTQFDLLVVNPNSPAQATLDGATDWIQRSWVGHSPLNISKTCWLANRDAVAELPAIQGLSRAMPKLIQSLGYRVETVNDSTAINPFETLTVQDDWTWRDQAGHRWLSRRWLHVDYIESQAVPNSKPNLRVTSYDDVPTRKAG